MPYLRVISNGYCGKRLISIDFNLKFLNELIGLLDQAVSTRRAVLQAVTYGMIVCGVFAPKHLACFQAAGLTANRCRFESARSRLRSPFAEKSEDKLLFVFGVF